MKCSECSKIMVWNTPKGTPRVDSISLQHWPDGSMSLICFSCNARLQGDWSLPPKGYKKCSRCQVVKAYDGFHKNASAWDNLNNECKLCVSYRDSVRGKK